MKRTRQNHAKGAAKSKSSKSSKKELRENDAKRQNVDSSCEKGAAQAPVEPVPEKSDNERPGSPDPNCSICLCKMDDKSFTNSCFHMFCFTCLVEWSKVKAVCPLCKQTFKSIIHNIRSESDYDVYTLKENAAFAATTSDTDDSLPPDLTMFGALDRHPVYPWHNLVTPFEYLPQVFNTMPPTWLHFQGVVVNEPDVRRRIYHSRRRVQEIQLPDGTNYRDISPEYFAANLDSDHVHQINAWLSRELNVLCPVQGHSNLKRLIMNLLTHFPIQSEHFYEHLHQYLGDRTRIFLNELYNFARSPLSITETDRLTIYDASSPTDVEVITLDRDDSDVEIISPPADGSAAAFDLRTSLRNESRSNSSDGTLLWSPPINGCVALQSKEAESRDNESPVAGPSGFLQRSNDLTPRAPEVCSSEPQVEEIFDNESSSNSNYDNEIMFVGFDKPWRARTPISLSSDDSDIDVADDLGVNLPVSSKASPVSEELLELDIKHGNGSAHTSGSSSKKFGNDDEFTNSSSWSNNILSEESLERRNGESSKSILQDHHLFSSNPDHHDRNENFGCSCGRQNNSSCTLPKCFDRFRCSDTRVADRNDPCCSGQGGNCKFRRKRLKSRRSRNRSRLRAECRWTLKRQRKNCHEDCGDSGVALGVKRHVESTSDTAEVKYKKHCRGHKKSSHKSEKEASNIGNNAGSHTENEFAALAPDRQSFGAGDSEHDVVKTLTFEAVNHQDHTSNSTSQNERQVSEKSEKDANSDVSSGSSVPDDSSDSYISSSSRRDSKKNLTSDQYTNYESRSTTASPAIDSATGDVIPPRSETVDSIICDLDAMSPQPRHEVESIDIDSEDSVQWLDFEKPNSETDRYRRLRSSLWSNGLLSSSNLANTDVLQVSDDDVSDESLLGCCNDLTSSETDSPLNLQIPKSRVATSCDSEDTKDFRSVDSTNNSLHSNAGTEETDEQHAQGVSKPNSSDSSKEIDGSDLGNEISNETASDEIETDEFDVNTIERLKEISEKILSNCSEFSSGNPASPETPETEFPHPVKNGFLSSNDASVSSSSSLPTWDENNFDLSLNLPPDSVLIPQK